MGFYIKSERRLFPRGVLQRKQETYVLGQAHSIGHVNYIFQRLSEEELEKSFRLPKFRASSRISNLPQPTTITTLPPYTSELSRT